jgi:hypothetical protein
VYIAFALNIRTLNLEVLNSLPEYIGKYEICSADRRIGTTLLLHISTVSLNTDPVKFKEAA